MNKSDHSAKGTVDVRKFAHPTPGQTVTVPSVEALCRYLKLHEATHEVLGWRGGVLVLRRKEIKAEKSL
jgi:hypothetical protein